MVELTLERVDRAFDQVVGRSLDACVIAEGLRFTEGPVWHPRERWLLFSDIPANRLYRWSEDKGLAVFRDPTNMTNGNTLDRKERLLCCEHAASRVTRTGADGQVTVLASHFDGRSLNSPNDIVVRRDGRIYFTDPTYGRMAADDGVQRECELPFRGVFRIDPDGKLVLLVDDFRQPNGLCFSRDESRLFINDSETGTVRVFAVAADGSLSGGAIWAFTGVDTSGSPDGMKIDGAENIYGCGPGGVYVHGPAGQILGRIRFPEPVANLAFGDDDFRSLYVTATTRVWRVRVQTPGLPVF
ncbi:MAG: SMP-30/gluconolactonase/LRE family protein [Alphaproteobacteria bacterium]|nr:SMP-30/gluconolactonase/LRE family protein [Alphaproteobacteria bacterium]